MLISEIKIGDNRRAVNPEKVKELSESIKEIGLLNPIIVDQNKVLIAGAHRIEAFQLLGRENIPANIVNLVGLKVELAEIDENIMRNEVHFIDRCDYVKRRKEIYEKMYPETKNGGDRRSENFRTSVCRSENKAFTEDTANKTGISIRTVQRDLERAEKLTPETKETIKTYNIGKMESLDLANMKPEQQKQVTEKIASGEAKNVKQAKELIPEMKMAMNLIPEAKKLIKARNMDQKDALKMANMDAERQKLITDSLESGAVKGIIQAIQKVNREQIKTQEIPLPKDKYNVLLIDPPWRYEFAETESRAIENQYPTMDLEDIKKLEIPACDDSVLFLWATAPKLEEALDLMNAWGFKYRTCSVWDKELIGMGYWFRSQHELLLVGVKGKFRTPDPENRFSSVYREKRSKHSKKPNAYYDMLEKMFPNGKYLEIFARQKYNESWEVWGNQCNADI